MSKLKTFADDTAEKTGVNKRKRIYEELYPETRNNSGFKGNQFRSFDKLSNEQKNFADDTAEKITITNFELTI